jgi:tetratricopeptide (TPR) repeat protein
MKMSGFWRRWKELVGYLILAAGTLIAYWPVLHFEFINMDDPMYVTENPHVQPGLTPAGLKWAFHATTGANWHPLTWISHMVDCQLYGPRAGGHHLTSVLLHLANSCLLFALLSRMTGKRAPSFVIAALFAWHPMHVESVAWIAERKDVLSTLFGLLALTAYVRYAQQRGNGRWKMEDGRPASYLAASHLPSSVFYLLSLICFALGLMSKPMLVTLPFLLLLLDSWPLGRFGEVQSSKLKVQSSKFLPLLWEKVPFFVLAALSCGLTLWAQGQGGAIAGINVIPLDSRIANAVLSYYRYLGKLVWPQNLAVFYVYYWPDLGWRTFAAGGLLLAISVGALWLRKFPYLAFGWYWFVVTLVPVIGLVQVGAQAMADRYSYVPSIGLFILVVFALSECSRKARGSRALQTLRAFPGPSQGREASGVRRNPPLSTHPTPAKSKMIFDPVLALLAALVLGAGLAATSRQLSYWRESEPLYRHAIAVTQANFVACNNLGAALEKKGRKEEAADWYREALRWKPDYADAHCNLANIYVALKRPREAVAEFEAALSTHPRSARAHYFFANVLLKQGDSAGAAEHYRMALAITPEYAEAHYQLAIALLSQDKVEEASGHYRQALRLKPDWLEALNNFAWLLATHPDARFRDGKLALELAARGVGLTQTNNPKLLDTLAGALAEVGRFGEATNAARTAARLAQGPAAEPLRREIEAHLKCYERGEAVRESSAPTIKSD